MVTCIVRTLDGVPVTCMRAAMVLFPRVRFARLSMAVFPFLRRVVTLSSVLTAMMLALLTLAIRTPYGRLSVGRAGTGRSVGLSVVLSFPDPCRLLFPTAMKSG